MLSGTGEMLPACGSMRIGWIDCMVVKAAWKLSNHAGKLSWNLMERVGNPRLCKPVRLYNQLHLHSY